MFENEGIIIKFLYLIKLKNYHLFSILLNIKYIIVKMAVISIISLKLCSIFYWFIKYLFCSKASIIYGMVSYHLLINYGMYLYSWLEGCFLNIEEFNIRTTINKIDRFLITKNITSRINIDHNIPMDGIHFNKNFGLVWFYRKTEPAGYDREPHTTYTIYSIYKCNTDKIRSFLEKKILLILLQL